MSKSIRKFIEGLNWKVEESKWDGNAHLFFVKEPENLEEKFRELAKNSGLKAGQLFFPIRIALTGRKESPPLFDTMCAIGKEKSINRLYSAISIIKS